MDILSWTLLTVVAVMLIVAFVRIIFYAPIKPLPPRDSDDEGGGDDSGKPWDFGSHHRVAMLEVMVAGTDGGGGH